MVYQIVVFYLAFLLGNAVFVSAAFAAARALGMQVLAVQIGQPAVFRRGLLTLGIVPYSAFVRVLDGRDNPRAADDPAAFNNQPRAVRVLFCLSGSAGLLALTLALRGLDGWTSFTHGFAQIVGGALDPTGRGADLVAGYLSFSAHAGLLASVGTIVAKITAGNLLPIPILAGGQALSAAILPNPGTESPGRWEMRLWHTALWVLVAIAASWAFAIYTATQR